MGIAAALFILSTGQGMRAADDILNASYDISRELFAQINPAFIAFWKEKSGQIVRINQSHGGSSKQAEAILKGLPADVVTFNQATDVNLLARSGLLGKDWEARFPGHSAPVYSFTGFLVRAGNPKEIRDWGDLAKPGVKVVFPNPKTSGNGRYTYLSAWAWAEKEFKGDRKKIEDYMGRVLANVPVFDTGGRGATNTFIERGVGDVLVTFEAENFGIWKKYGERKFKVITPSLGIRADFPVAVVDRVVDRRGTREVATAYLKFLYSPQGQEILARNHYRVRDAKVAAKYSASFPKVTLVTIDEAFGGWSKVHKIHIEDGGTFDRLLEGAAGRKRP